MDRKEIKSQEFDEYDKDLIDEYKIAIGLSDKEIHRRLTDRLKELKKSFLYDMEKETNEYNPG